MKKRNLVIGSVFLFIVLVGGVFMLKSKKQNDAKKTQSVSQQENQISNGQQVNDIQSQQQIQENQLVWYEIPELGIKFPVNETVKEDLIYVFSESLKYKRKAAAFSLESISGNGELCSAERGPLGAIARIEGRFKQRDLIYGCIAGTLVKQFDSFFLCSSGPQAPSGCFKSSEDNYLDVNKYIPFDKIEKL